MADVVIAQEVMRFLADNEVPPREDGVRRIWLEVEYGEDATRVHFRRVGVSEFPDGGMGQFFDSTPVFWVRKTVTRGQLDGLVDSARRHLAFDKPLPPELGSGDYLDGALIVTFPAGVTRDQIRELQWALKYQAPSAEARFHGVALGSGISLSITDGVSEEDAQVSAQTPA